MQVILPNQWRPRPYQRQLWRYLESGGKRAVAVWHRRAGKDEVCLHWAACAAMQRIGNYWHMLPEASQARKAIWDAVNPHTGIRRIDEAFPAAIRAGERQADMHLRLVNGSTWQIVGSDNFNSLVGAPPTGLVFSEYSLTDPAAWDYLRPILLAAVCDNALGAVLRLENQTARDGLFAICGGEGSAVTAEQLIGLVRAIDELKAGQQVP